MNFYEFYQLLKENTVSQELKKLGQKDILVSFIIDEAKKEIKKAFNNISDGSLNALSKWLVYTTQKSREEKREVLLFGGPVDPSKQITLSKMIIRTNVNMLKDGYGDYLEYNIDNTGDFNPSLLSKLNNLTFKKQDLKALSDQYHEDLKKQRGGIPGAPGETILSFPDGYKWVNLNKDYCEREGRAGLHCGNVGRQPGDTILSLRDNKDLVYLTFVLNNGVLVERKAKQNLKPKSKYHPYIIELLKLPIIKNIGPGRYDPKNDFQLNDLSEKQLEDLLKAKPEFEKSLLLNYFNNFIETEKFSSRSAMIEKIKGLESSFPNQIKKEISIVLKYTYKHAVGLNDVDKVFSESELIEILNNEKIIYLDNTYKTSMGETLDILDRIAYETKREKVQKEILKILKENPNIDVRKVFTSLINNPNVSQELSKKITELLEILFFKGNNDHFLNDPRMPEKILRQVVSSERYEKDHPYIVKSNSKGYQNKEIQSKRLYYIAKNPNCPSDLLDKLSEDKDEFVIEEVIYNKNTKVETLRNILKNLEAVPHVYNWLPSTARRIYDRLTDVLKRINTPHDLRNLYPNFLI